MAHDLLGSSAHSHPSFAFPSLFPFILCPVRQGKCNTTKGTFTTSAKLLSTYKESEMSLMHFGMESMVEQALHEESCRRQDTHGKGMVQKLSGASEALAGFVLI